MLIITDQIKGDVTEVKSKIRAFGVKHPLTLATITLFVGLGVGAFLG
jgi:hypothetical protein